MHGSYLKPLQKIAHSSGDLHLTAEYLGGNDKFNFHVGPSLELHNGKPSFGIQGGLTYNFREGGEGGDGEDDGDGNPSFNQGMSMEDFYNNYIDTDKYEDRLRSSGYTNPEDIASQRLFTHAMTKVHHKDRIPSTLGALWDKYVNDKPGHPGGSAYLPSEYSDAFETTFGDILVYKQQAEDESTTMDDIEAHERAHAMVKDAELNEYDQRQFSDREKESSRNKGYRRGKKIPIGNQQLEEYYSDMNALRYHIFNDLGIDPTKDITDEDMSKIQNLIKDSNYKSSKRLFDAYSPEDIKWMLNNIASNQDVSSDQLQMAKDGSSRS